MRPAPNNPFAPGFGYPPPALTGRSEFVHKTLERISIGVGTDDLSTVVTGPRGVGKTAAVHDIMKKAENEGWTVIYTVGRPNPPPKEDVPYTIVRKCERILELGLPGKTDDTGKHAQAASIGVGYSRSPAHRLDGSVWEALLTVLDEIDVKKGGRGVLLVIDELHNVSESHIGPVSAAVLELTGLERRKLAFIGVGLPHLEYIIMNNPGFTFLQRSHRAVMSHINYPDAERAIGIPLSQGGVSISSGDLSRLAIGTLGNGYAIQSVGKYVWDLCGGPGCRVTPEHVTQALELMDADVDKRIVAPMWNRLAPLDIEYLMIMSRHEGPMSPAIMTRAMGDTARTYKKRLLDDGVIVDILGGKVWFASTAVRKRATAERLERDGIRAESQRFNTAIRQSGTFQ